MKIYNKPTLEHINIDRIKEVRTTQNTYNNPYISTGGYIQKTVNGKKYYYGHWKKEELHEIRDWLEKHDYPLQHSQTITGLTRNQYKKYLQEIIRDDQKND